MLGRDRARREEKLLAEIAEESPEWDVRRPGAIWEAVPAGTPVVSAMTLDDLRERLAQRDGKPGEGDTI
jgi:hypothetical protein